MDTSGEHPAERHAVDVQTAQRRAWGAVALLGATALCHAVDIPVRLWQHALVRRLQAGDYPPQDTLELSDTLVLDLGLTNLALLLATAFVFLRWLHKLTSVARALGGATPTWTPRDAVLGFVVPFVNFVRPYHIVRDVHDALAPDLVPEPPVQVRASEVLGYRQLEVQTPPPPARLPRAAIGAWWGAFLTGNLLANIALRVTGADLGDIVLRNALQAAASAVDVVGALLAVVMVRSLTARLRERFRRVRHTPPEALAAAGVLAA